MYSDGVLFLMMVAVPTTILAAFWGLAIALGDRAYRPIRLPWSRR